MKFVLNKFGKVKNQGNPKRKERKKQLTIIIATIANAIFIIAVYNKRKKRNNRNKDRKKTIEMNLNNTKKHATDSFTINLSYRRAYFAILKLKNIFLKI